MYVDILWRNLVKMQPNIGSASTPPGTLLSSENTCRRCIPQSPGASFALARSNATVTASSPGSPESVAERCKCITWNLCRKAAPRSLRWTEWSRSALGITGCSTASSTARSNGRHALTSTGRARRAGSVRSGSTTRKPHKDQAAPGTGYPGWRTGTAHRVSAGAGVA
jgi:hypothetical protein